MSLGFTSVKKYIGAEFTIWAMKRGKIEETTHRMSNSATQTQTLNAKAETYMQRGAGKLNKEI